ncbi:hypothetical protein RF11_04776 [Thelohanellus kitauei]|uniref:Uncharacterized protein n=1 Tax=Thelohanellus kitauei TaxID=669202 RepID=A0A0C2MDX0_THEKT|nr:hypothetical protein RF11_04776 [Thelohanellus kitauei]
MLIRCLRFQNIKEGPQIEKIPLHHIKNLGSRSHMKQEKRPQESRDIDLYCTLRDRISKHGDCLMFMDRLLIPKSETPFYRNCTTRKVPSEVSAKSCKPADFPMHRTFLEFLGPLEVKLVLVAIEDFTKGQKQSNRPGSRTLIARAITIFGKRLRTWIDNLTPVERDIATKSKVLVLMYSKKYHRWQVEDIENVVGKHREDEKKIEDAKNQIRDCFNKTYRLDWAYSECWLCNLNSFNSIHELYSMLLELLKRAPYTWSEDDALYHFPAHNP